MPQRAEKRFAVGQIDAREECERSLVLPTTRRHRRADRRTAERANHGVGVEDATPFGLGRNVMREHRSQIVAGGRKDRRSLSAQKDGDVG
jgi:hypothetical protein